VVNVYTFSTLLLLFGAKIYSFLMYCMVLMLLVLRPVIILEDKKIFSWLSNFMVRMTVIFGDENGTDQVL
jgi:hypothetical protein